MQIIEKTEQSSRNIFQKSMRFSKQILSFLQRSEKSWTLVRIKQPNTPRSKETNKSANTQDYNNTQTKEHTSKHTNTRNKTNQRKTKRTKRNTRNKTKQ